MAIKEIAMTTDFEVSKCRTIRKMEMDEMIEAFG